MIIVTAKITAKLGEKDNIISKTQDLIDSSRLESGCISYNLYTSTEDKNVLLMLEQWENQDALRLHMQTEHFKTFNTAIKDNLEGEVNISVYSAESIN
ncbi:putative quinol monooxygenase [Methanobacterium sp.]|uniref:putative quinol monooxygenase n=1 Tax=Methanobacterium sp. TaxID=2164 RepID=UPI003C74EFDA